MWTEQSSPKFLIVIAASIVAHVVLLAVLPPADSTASVPERTFVTFEAAPSPPPPPPVVETPVAPETVAARMPTPHVKRPSAPRRAIEQQVATQPTPAVSPEMPMDFSGVTLSNEGASWSSPTGNGEAITGPIGGPASATHRGPVRTATATERVVAVGDLSRPPRAPNLDAALAANYPSEARRAGTTGTAVIRARILADGRVGAMRVVSESAAGFGVACQRTLSGSHWEPPLDASSRPVITDISYTCTFAVTR
jgi:outer membrane biosynthesis protein TonB